MATQALAVISMSGNIVANPAIRFSTATLPGLIQSYCQAGEHLLAFYPQPEKLRVALDNPANQERVAFFLQQGAKALNALECLEDGEADALHYARILISGMVRDLYRRAEKEGAE